MAQSFQADAHQQAETPAHAAGPVAVSSGAVVGRSSSPVYTVLARRTRPQSLESLVGQDILRAALTRMLETQNIPHAFLFTGTRGVGKTSTARILAKSLNCEKGPTPNPCQVCEHCTEITNSTYEDVVEIDAASHTGVDSIRDLQESTRFFPVKGRYKIYIIDEVHMLSQGAFNALLKTLEEPPPQVIFLLATTELHKVPVTVRSRCLVFALRKVPVAELAQHLGRILQNEGWQCDAQALMLIAREAKGSVRDALSLLEQVLALESGKALSLERVTQALNLVSGEWALHLFVALVDGDVTGALHALERADAMGLDGCALLEECARYFFAVVVHHSTRTQTPQNSGMADILDHEKAHIQRAATLLGQAAASELFRYLTTQAREASRMPSPFTWLQITLLDALSRRQWLSSGELLQLLGAAQPVSQGAAAPVTAPPSAAYKGGHAVPTQPPLVSAAPLLPTAPVGPRVRAEVAVPQQQPLPPVAPVGSAGSGFLGEFRKVLSVLQSTHAALYARLSHAQIESFSQEALVFMGTAENEIYTRLSPDEESVLKNALKECGYTHTKLVKRAVKSVSDLKKAEVRQDIAERERATKANPAVQNLLKVARSVTFAPIEEDPSS